MDIQERLKVILTEIQETTSNNIEEISEIKTRLIATQCFEQAVQLSKIENNILELIIAADTLTHFQRSKKISEVFKSNSLFNLKPKFNSEIEIADLKSKCDAISLEIKNIQTGNEDLWPIGDGIINIDQYVNAKFKILWILKEPWDEIDEYGPHGGGWNNADELNQKLSGSEFGSDSKTYFPIIHSAYGILNNFCLWNDIEDADKSLEVFETLKKIAVINVKKTPGNKNTPSSILSNAYNDYKELLLRQIEVYNPDIIIGGSTLNLFYNDLSIEKSKMTNRRSINYFATEDRIFIDAYHPAYWSIKKEDYCNDIILAVKHLVC